MKQHLHLYWLQSVTSASWERKTYIGGYLHITNNESVTNKYIACVSLCFAFIKLHKLGGKGVNKGCSHYFPLMDDDVQD